MQRTLSILSILALFAAASFAAEPGLLDSPTAVLTAANAGLQALPAPFLVDPLFAAPIQQNSAWPTTNCTDCFLACEAEFEQCFAGCNRSPGCRGDCIMQYSFCGDICMMSCLP